MLLPEPPAAPSRADKDDDRDTPSPGKTSFEKVKVKFSDTVVIPHEGEVNKARCVGEVDKLRQSAGAACSVLSQTYCYLRKVRRQHSNTLAMLASALSFHP